MKNDNSKIYIYLLLFLIAYLIYSYAEKKIKQSRYSDTSVYVYCEENILNNERYNNLPQKLKADICTDIGDDFDKLNKIYEATKTEDEYYENDRREFVR